MAFPWNPPPPDPPTLPIITSREEGEEEGQEEEEVDNIGDTVFSKVWVLSVLVKMVGTVQKKVQGRGGGGKGESVGMFLM